MLRFTPNLKEDISLNALRIAIFSYIVSKQKKENLIIQISDIETSKNIEEKSKKFLELLSLFSIEYQNIIYQSSHFKYYQKMAMQLLTQKKAFSCFCSDEKLKTLEKYDDFCQSLSDETVLNTNAPFRIRIKKENYKNFDSFEILNQAKSPKYNYASAIDDMLMNISTVIQDKKYLKNIQKQEHIRKSLNYEKKIDYINIASILDDISVEKLIDEGFLPSAIANYLVLLGYEAPKEIFTLEEAIQWFDINKISKNTPKFDIEELKHINKKYLESIDELRLSKLLGFADIDIGKLAKLYLKEVYTLKEIKEKINLIFSSKNPLEGFEEEFITTQQCLKNAVFIDDFEKLKQYTMTNTNIKEESLDKILNHLLLGDKNEINISNIYPFIRNYLGEIIR